MAPMFQAAIRWCLTGLLVAVHVPVPGASGPAAAGAGASRAACCAPKACCTVAHACAAGGGCALDGHGVHGSQGRATVSAPVLAAGSCHPEAARAGHAAALDPIVFTALPGPFGAGPIARSAFPSILDPASRATSPRVPPPRA